MDFFCYLCFVFVRLAFLSVHCNLVVTSWERANLLAFLVLYCHFHMWCSGPGVVVDCIDSCPCLLTYFAIFFFNVYSPRSNVMSHLNPIDANQVNHFFYFIYDL